MADLKSAVGLAGEGSHRMSFSRQFTLEMHPNYGAGVMFWLIRKRFDGS
jgi:hypothetical protein